MQKSRPYRCVCALAIGPSQHLAVRQFSYRWATHPGTLIIPATHISQQPIILSARQKRSSAYVYVAVRHENLITTAPKRST
jgi:hypothetical protein